jgi:hypothetical protein
MLPGILPNPWILLGVGVAFVAVATGSFFAGAHYQKLEDSDAINAQKIAVAHELQENLQHVLDVERERDAFKNQLDVQNAQHKAQIETERSRTLDVITAHGGLYVPGRSGSSCSDPVPKANGNATGPTATISYCQLDVATSSQLASAAAQCDGFLADLHTAQDAIANQPK